MAGFPLLFMGLLGGGMLLSVLVTLAFGNRLGVKLGALIIGASAIAAAAVLTTWICWMAWRTGGLDVPFVRRFARLRGDPSLFAIGAAIDLVAPLGLGWVGWMCIRQEWGRKDRDTG